MKQGRCLCTAGITPATSHIVQFVRPKTLLLTGAVARWMWNRGALQTVTTWSVISTNCIISTTVIIYIYIQYFCFLFTKIFVFVSMMLVSSDFLRIPARLKIRVDLSPQRSIWNLPQSVRRILGKPGHFTISFWKDWRLWQLWQGFDALTIFEG